MSAPVRAADVVTRVVAGETLVVPVRRRVADLSSIFVLNETASRVWELADGTRTASEIARVIAAEFEVDAATAATDVAELITDLRARQLLDAGGDG